MAIGHMQSSKPKGPALVLITSTHAVAYKGRTVQAVYEIKEPLDAEDIEAIRTNDLPIEEPAS